jgi:3-phosphoshikimate 1-carboxyvinyltransferase
MPGPIDAAVRPPGSKSETIRALTAAALAPGRSHLYMPLRADDTEAMSEALNALGVTLHLTAEPWTVEGTGGRLTVPSAPIDAHESGLSARILIALAGALDGTTRLIGRGRLPERPMSGVTQALRSQGVEVTADAIPLEIKGRGRLRGGPIRVDCSLSSQFATALMLVAPTMSETCVLDVEGLAGSEGYLDMTVDTMRRFGAAIERTVTGYEIENTGYTPGDVVIEPDASAAVYPMGIAAVTGGRVVIEGLAATSLQPDIRMVEVLERMGCTVDRHTDRIVVTGPVGPLASIHVDMSDAPDASLALAVVCLFADGESRIDGLASLRHKESDRLIAIQSELTRVGGVASVEGDSLVIGPGTMSGAEIDPHGDHRIAMAMGIAGTRLPGLSVANPGVVDKTWPGFWRLLDLLAAESAP